MRPSPRVWTAVRKRVRLAVLAVGNGKFAQWKLVLDAMGTRRFTAGPAVEKFAYFRGKPLKKICHGRGTVRLMHS